MKDARTERRAAINRVLHDLRRLPCADNVVVFGSMAKGAPDPGDVDIMVTGSRHRGHALALAYRHYPLLDVFIDHEGALFVRNCDATGWERSSCAKQMRASIREDGRPLSEIKDLSVPGEES